MIRQDGWRVQGEAGQAGRDLHLDLVIGVLQDDVRQIEHGCHACAPR